MSDSYSPAEHANQIAAARDLLEAFAAACTDEDWQSRPLAAEGDPRPVGVIVDHVAHGYEYMGGWIRQIVAGDNPQIDGALVDRLNAGHAAGAEQLTQAGAIEHLRGSGDELIALISGLAASDLDLGDGLVRRIAVIAARHPDTHRTEIQDALRAPSQTT
jgi:hypothetical protein